MPSGTPSSDASGSQHRDDSTDGCSNPGSSHQSSSSSEESVGRGRSQGEVSSPVDKKDAALHLLLETGISAARACQALDATEEHASSPTAWAEEAQTWLAVDQEHADESAKLAEGMHASLEESQKETAPSCFEQTPAQLLETFEGSPLIQQLQHCEAGLGHPLACDPWPRPLVGYLVLERRCMRWYAAARAFYRAQAEEACAALQGSPAGLQGSPAGVGPQRWDAFLASLAERQAEVERAVYAMPANGDLHAATDIPALFQGYAADTEVDVIDLCD
ncbi:hypothetical protein ACKKBF_B00485 [Auxenochlorella protothecoides x Auxenochlorella symbiontica]